MTVALLIRRACFQAAGDFDPALPPVEDWDLWLRIARQFEAVYVDEPLVKIRLDPTHASRHPEIIYSRNLRVLDKFARQFPDEARRFAPTLRRQRARFHRALAEYYRATRRPFAALPHVARMIAHAFL